jgi:hypothetical protein
MSHHHGAVWRLAAAAVTLAACGHVGTPPTTGSLRPPVSASTSTPGNQPATPDVIHSVVVRHRYVRLPLPSADLSHLVRVRGNTIEALTTGGAFDGQTHAARSDDDGGSWRIDSPRFNGAAASGGSQIDHIWVSGSTLFAWGRDGVNIWTRQVNGQRWRVACVGPVRRADARASQIQVVVQPEGSGRRTTYVSNDGGRVWRRAL